MEALSSSDFWRLALTTPSCSLSLYLPSWHRSVTATSGVSSSVMQTKLRSCYRAAVPFVFTIIPLLLCSEPCTRVQADGLSTKVRPTASFNENFTFSPLASSITMLEVLLYLLQYLYHQATIYAMPLITFSLYHVAF